jgi:hypothetical protein
MNFRFPRQASLPRLLVLLLAMLVPLPSAAGQEKGLQLTYEGTMIADQGDPLATRKQFDLTLTVVPGSGQDAVIYWVVNEQGNTMLPWPYQLGRIDWKADPEAPRVLGGDQAELSQPAFAYEHEETAYAVSIVVPYLQVAGTLKEGQTWQQGPVRYRVGALVKFRNQQARQLIAFNAFGVKRTLYLQPETEHLVGLTETVFLGMGKEHELTLHLEKQQELGGEALKKSVTAYQRLLSLRDELAREARGTELTLDEDQLKLLRAGLDDATAAVKDTPLAAIAVRARQDARDQKGRSGGVALLESRSMGKTLAKTGFTPLRGSEFSDQQFQQSVVVLHFWEYQDKPLREPYGQVGYLDFLYRKYSSKGLKVFGVVADAKLEDATLRQRTLQSARKFVTFMNVSYPMLVDSESYLRKVLGDPRAAGARLPLFLVLDKQGKVVHYHVGFYDVDRDRGLQKLDAEVIKALGIDE